MIISIIHPCMGNIPEKLLWNIQVKHVKHWFETYATCLVILCFIVCILYDHVCLMQVLIMGLIRTLTMLRTLIRTLFMLIMLPNYALSISVTLVDLFTSFVWLFKKYSQKCMHVCAPLSKVVAHLLRNKSCFMIISWKWPEHPQKWPRSLKAVLF
jgi:hypothetical protein